MAQRCHKTGPKDYPLGNVRSAWYSEVQRILRRLKEDWEIHIKRLTEAQRILRHSFFFNSGPEAQRILRGEGLVSVPGFFAPNATLNNIPVLWHICTLVFFWIALTEGWIQFSREKEYLWERVFFFTYVRRSPINQRFFFFLILIHFSLSTMKTWILLWTLFIDFMEFGLLEKKEDRRTFSFHRLNEQGPLTSRFWRRSRFSKRKPIFLSNSLSL